MKASYLILDLVTPIASLWEVGEAVVHRGWRVPEHVVTVVSDGVGAERESIPTETRG